jgi:surface protein
MRKSLFILTLLSGLLLASCSPTDSTTQFQVVLSSSPADAGDVTPETGQYDEGTTLEISARANEGWRFIEWTGDHTGTNSTTTITVDADKNISAIYEKKSYALTINTTGSGTVDEKILQNKATDYDHGTVVELTANPATGWIFVEWQGDVTGSQNPHELTVDNPKDVTAVFEKESQSLFYLAQNGITIKCEDATIGDTGTVNGITYTKRSASQITPGNAETSCTSGVSSMRFMFQKDASLNGDISSWDVSGVKDMGGMFWGAESFNGDISSWDVGNVRDMANMFFNADSFNGDLSDWDVSNVTEVAGMFKLAVSFNQDLNDWDLSNVKDMQGMFTAANSFNGDISNWNVSNITDMEAMFRSADSFNQNISNWDVSSVTTMEEMFSNAISFNGDISTWDVSSVTNMVYMFNGASTFDTDLSGWCVPNISSEPNGFADNSPIEDSSNLPAWGTCP